MSILLATLLSLFTPDVSDSLRTTDIEEIVVVSTPKENQRLRQQPVSSTSLSQDAMRERGIKGIKDFSATAPNLFIPDYGSHLTTAMYVRGVGSRIGTPAVALYIDGVPQVSAASYDFNFANVDRVDLLRGPQSTLYGRNSMGGVIRVFTKNPMQYQGTDITLDASHAAGPSRTGHDDGGGIGRYRLNLTHYHRVSDRFAFTGHLFGDIDGGYFRNEARNNEHIDDGSDLGARMRFIIKPKQTLDFDLTLSHEWLNQGGYPYEYRGTVAQPTTPEPQTAIGHIAYNNRSGYRRNLTNVGLTTTKRWPQVMLTSVTGYQHLHDRMKLDQDFTDTDLYTLIQRQNSNTFSEELLLKPIDSRLNTSGFNYTWLVGANAIQQWTTADAPVTFYEDGLGWLNGLINGMANKYMPTVPGNGYVMNFAFDNQIHGTNLNFPGIYDTPATNIALFHQSTLNNLFGVAGLNLTAGLRADYENMNLNYRAWYGFHQTYALGGRLTFPDGSVREGMTLVPEKHFDVNDELRGEFSNDYLQLLPKLTLQYCLPESSALQRSSIYASVSRGYRSGGFNIQMFNELLQNRMQTKILKNVTDVTLPIVRDQPSMPPQAKETVEQILTSMSEEKPLDVKAATWYKPESSWNYEVGGHFNFFEARLQADVSAFLMETRNQQVSKMTAGGLGRITENSGKSRSAGLEASLHAMLTDDLSLDAAYGFTHAKFHNDEQRTFVPFVPRHTFSVGATQQWTLNAGAWLDTVSLHADYRGAGRIYWTEDNNAWQNFAGSLNARLSVTKKDTELSLYAHNILSTRFQTFYFETMKRAFAQYTRPLELGLQLRLRF